MDDGLPGILRYLENHGFTMAASSLRQEMASKQNGSSSGIFEKTHSMRFHEGSTALGFLPQLAESGISTSAITRSQSDSIAFASLPALRLPGSAPGHGNSDHQVWSFSKSVGAAFESSVDPILFTTSSLDLSLPQQSAVNKFLSFTEADLPKLPHVRLRSVEKNLDNVVKLPDSLALAGSGMTSLEHSSGRKSLDQDDVFSGGHVPDNSDMVHMGPVILASSIPLAVNMDVMGLGLRRGRGSVSHGIVGSESDDNAGGGAYMDQIEEDEDDGESKSWCSNEYEGEQDLGYSRRLVEDEVWFLEHEAMQSRRHGHGRFSGSSSSSMAVLPSPMDTTLTKEKKSQDMMGSTSESSSEHGGQVGIDAEFYFSGEEYYQGHSDRNTSRSVDPGPDSGPISISVIDLDPPGEYGIGEHTAMDSGKQQQQQQQPDEEFGSITGHGSDAAEMGSSMRYSMSALGGSSEGDREAAEEDMESLWRRRQRQENMALVHKDPREAIAGHVPTRPLPPLLMPDSDTKEAAPERCGVLSASVDSADGTGAGAGGVGFSFHSLSPSSNGDAVSQIGSGRSLWSTQDATSSHFPVEEAAQEDTASSPALIGPDDTLAVWKRKSTHSSPAVSPGYYGTLRSRKQWSDDLDETMEDRLRTAEKLVMTVHAHRASLSAGVSSMAADSSFQRAATFSDNGEGEEGEEDMAGSLLHMEDIGAPLEVEDFGVLLTDGLLQQHREMEGAGERGNGQGEEKMSHADCDEEDGAVAAVEGHGRLAEEEREEQRLRLSLQYDTVSENKFDVFSLKIVHKKNMTGFEDAKDFPALMDTVVAGRYLVKAVLGSAAFSKAVRASDLRTGMDVCMKIIKNNKDFFDQSLDEVKLLKYINSNDPTDRHHILRLFDYFYHSEHLFIVCELLQANLYEFQRERPEGWFNMKRLQTITQQCLEALKFMHGLNLIHCDLKPENIMMKDDSKCEIKVIDLGSSCFQTDNLCSYVQSRSYRAPEVILGLNYSNKIDIWSVGCILAELYTGQVLFVNDSLATLLARVVGILGPIDPVMINQGRESHKYFTKRHKLFERNQETEMLEYIIPKRTTLKHRLANGDPDFVDFVQTLLQVDPERRPSAEQALEHRWLSVDYS